MESKTACGTVDHHLAAGHRRIEKTLEDVKGLSAAGSFFSAAKRLGEALRELEAHARDDEDVLLPLFVARTGDPHHLGERVRAGHRETLASLNATLSSLSRWDHVALCLSLVELRAALRTQHLLEERLLHPALDDVIRSATEWFALIDGSRALGRAVQWLGGGRVQGPNLRTRIVEAAERFGLSPAEEAALRLAGAAGARHAVGGEGRGRCDSAR